MTRTTFEAESQTERRDYHYRTSVGYGGRLARKLISAGAISLGDIKIPSVHQQQGTYALALESILAAGLNALRYSGYCGWVAISRKKEEYKQNKTLQRQSYDAVIAVMDGLEAAGYIETEAGHCFFDKSKQGRRTTYRLTEACLDRLDRQAPGWDTDEQEDSVEGVSYKKIRGTSKIIEIDVPRSQKLQKIIRAAQEYTWTPAEIRPRYHQVQIVEGNTVYGGRLYSNHTHLPSETRESWGVDGKPLVEIDIRGSHVALLYSLAGVAMSDRPADHYTLFEGQSGDVRYLFKFAMQRVINCKSKEKATKSISDMIREDTRASAGYRDLLDLLSSLLLSHISTLTPSPIGELIIPKPYKSLSPGQLIVELLGQFHGKIKQYFGCEIGLHLQGIEGDQNLAVLDACADANIPCLALHDAYYTTAEHAAAVEALIHQELLRSGFAAKLRTTPLGAHNAQTQASEATEGGGRLSAQPIPISVSTKAHLAPSDVVKDITNDIPTGVAGAPPNDAVLPKPSDTACPARRPLDPPWSYQRSQQQASPSAVANNLISYCTLTPAERADPNLDWTLMDW